MKRDQLYANVIYELVFNVKPAANASPSIVALANVVKANLCTYMYTNMQGNETQRKSEKRKSRSWNIRQKCKRIFDRFATLHKMCDRSVQILMRRIYRQGGSSAEKESDLCFVFSGSAFE